MAFPFMALAMLASSLIPALAGGKGKQKQTTTQKVPPRGYQSPMMGLMDLLKNMKYFQSSKLPGGGRFGSGSIDKILGLLGGNWDKLIGGYSQTAKPPSYAPRSGLPWERGG